MCFYEDGGWYCFGCHQGGDAVALYAAMNRMDMYEAAKQLAARYGIEVRQDTPKRPNTARKPVDVSGVLQALRAWEHERWERMFRIERFAHQTLEGFTNLNAAWDDPRIVMALRARTAAGMELDQMQGMSVADLIQLYKQEGMNA